MLLIYWFVSCLSPVLDRHIVCHYRHVARRQILGLSSVRYASLQHVDVEQRAHHYACQHQPRRSKTVLRSLRRRALRWHINIAITSQPSPLILAFHQFHVPPPELAFVLNCFSRAFFSKRIPLSHLSCFWVCGSLGVFLM